MTNTSIFRDLATSIFRYAMFKVKQEELAQDIVSETWIRLFANENWEQIPVSQLNAWCIGIARNIIYEEYRQQIKTPQSDHLLDMQPEPSHKSIENEAISSELLRILQQAMTQLDDITQEVITLHVWQQLRFHEIAQLLDIKQNSVKTLYYRGLDTLKSSLNNHRVKLRSISVGLLALAPQPSQSLIELLMEKHSNNINLLIIKQPMTKAQISQALRNPAMWGILLVAVLVIAGVGIVTLQLTSQNKSGEQAEGQTISAQVSYSNSVTTESAYVTFSTSSAAPTSYLFTGNYVTATLPNGWTIVEYENGAGDVMLLDGAGVTYTGLTGLEIIDDGGQIVFTLGAVQGIGGVGCALLHQFPDSDPQYIANQIAQDSQVGIQTQVITVPAGTYTELQILGVSARRFENRYLFDNSNSGAFFNAECGISGSVQRLTGISFNLFVNGVADRSNPDNDYQISLTANLSASTLSELDGVLSTLSGI